MSKISGALGFITGALVGGVIVWCCIKEKYAVLAEEEIASVKEAYTSREEPRTDEPEAEQIAMPVSKAPEKDDIIEYARRINGEGYTDYSRTVDQKPGQRLGETPYVISPDEFGEIEEYTKVSLAYFSDGVLADEYGETVDDVEEIVGDALNHFGEYEEDSVFVRSDAKRCDYEVLKDLRKFPEFLKTLPPKHD